MPSSGSESHRWLILALPLFIIHRKTKEANFCGTYDSVPHLHFAFCGEPTSSYSSSYSLVILLCIHGAVGSNKRDSDTMCNLEQSRMNFSQKKDNQYTNLHEHQWSKNFFFTLRKTGERRTSPFVGLLHFAKAYKKTFHFTWEKCWGPVYSHARSPFSWTASFKGFPWLNVIFSWQCLLKVAQSCPTDEWLWG